VALSAGMAAASIGVDIEDTAWLAMASMSHWCPGTHSCVWPILQCSVTGRCGRAVARDAEDRGRHVSRRPQVGMEHMSSRRAGGNSSGCAVNHSHRNLLAGEAAELADEAPGVASVC